MKINHKINELITVAHKLFCRWLMLLMPIELAEGGQILLVQLTDNLMNAPPQLKHWYGSRYGLWRLWGKPVPIGTMRFRRT